MLFPSVVFLFYFLPLFIVIYCAAPGVVAKNVVLLAASLLFYAWGEPRFVPLLIASIGVNYGFALAIGAAAPPRRRLVTAAGIAINLALLGLFKYANFAIGTLNGVLGSETLPLAGIALPLGISFFTFQQIAYLVDVMRGAKIERDIVSYTLFVSFFPHLIAGPLVASCRDDPAIQARPQRPIRGAGRAGAGDLRRRSVQEGRGRRQSGAVRQSCVRASRRWRRRHHAVGMACDTGL
jgi:D-alanyl-lipoteichoic acid acyltransferase DltB (MBOAT superfamily)